MRRTDTKMPAVEINMFMSNLPAQGLEKTLFLLNIPSPLQKNVITDQAASVPLYYGNRRKTRDDSTEHYKRSSIATSGAIISYIPCLQHSTKLRFFHLVPVPVLLLYTRSIWR